MITYIIRLHPLVAEGFQGVGRRMDFHDLKMRFVITAMFLVLVPSGYSESIGGVDILNYELDIVVSPHEREMLVTAKFDLDDLGVGRVDFSLNEAMLVEDVVVDGEQTSYDHHGNILSIPLKFPGGHDVTVKYRSSEEELLFGDLMVGYLGGPDETTFMVYRAAWYPIVLGDRATATVRITVPNGYTPITVGERIGVEEADAWRVYSWKTDKTVPGVSFVVGEFAERSAVAYLTDGEELRTWKHSSSGKAKGGIQFVEISCYLSPRDEFLAESCISRAEKILRYFASKFGGYPYQRFSLVEMSENFFGGHGAMGLVMIHPSALRGGSEELLAHEIAHNWWGASISVKKGYNLRTLGSPNIRMGEALPNDLWLHEGMATYSSILYLENARGKTSMGNSLRQKLSEYFKTGGRSSISSASEDYTKDEYHATVYSKGALVLHMLRYVMGDESFFKLMESYATKYAGVSVESRDFENLAGEVYGGDLRWFFDEWIRGNGLPDYAVGGVKVEEKNGGFVTTVIVAQRGDAVVMPLEVTLATENQVVAKRVMVDGAELEVKFESWDKPVYVELDNEGWLIEESRANNLYVLDYSIGLHGAKLIWRRLARAEILGALKLLLIP